MSPLSRRGAGASSSSSTGIVGTGNSFLLAAPRNEDRSWIQETKTQYDARGNPLYQKQRITHAKRERGETEENTITKLRGENVMPAAGARSFDQEVVVQSRTKKGQMNGRQYIEYETVTSEDKGSHKELTRKQHFVVRATSPGTGGSSSSYHQGALTGGASSSYAQLKNVGSSSRSGNIQSNNSLASRQHLALPNRNAHLFANNSASSSAHQGSSTLALANKRSNIYDNLQRNNSPAGGAGSNKGTLALMNKPSAASTSTALVPSNIVNRLGGNTSPAVSNAKVNELYNSYLAKVRGEASSSMKSDGKNRANSPSNSKKADAEASSSHNSASKKSANKNSSPSSKKKDEESSEEEPEQLDEEKVVLVRTKTVKKQLLNKGPIIVREHRRMRKVRPPKKATVTIKEKKVKKDDLTAAQKRKLTLQKKVADLAKKKAEKAKGANAMKKATTAKKPVGRPPGKKAAVMKAAPAMKKSMKTARK